MHATSRQNMALFVERFLAAREGSRLDILDIGSMDVNGSYRPLFSRPSWRYVGADIQPGANVDIVLRDHYRWRHIRSESFDVVISGQAFEHIPLFWLTMREIARVLKPGGLCCIIAPSEGPEHRYPQDCWRFLPDGMRALAAFAGLEVLECYRQPGLTGTDGDEWRDCVLVCRKPKLTLLNRVLSFWRLK